MYINPDTKVNILKNVPLDTTYEHTIFFADKTSQFNYFYGKKKYNLDDYSYQRVNLSVIRVGMSADDLYDCNYIMFQNTAFGNKWFYAFIKSIEYVNNGCAELTYEIDVMQTWFFDCSPDYCFIDREHSSTDTIGGNIQPEPIAIGEYILNSYEPVEIMRDMSVIIAIVDVETGAVDGNVYDGIYGGAELWAYQATDVTGINNKIAEFIESPESVLSVYMLPNKFLGGTINSGYKLTYGMSGVTYDVTLPRVTIADTLDGYKPKNMKMYTYPYNYLHIDNASGASLALRYELFASLIPSVKISTTLTMPVSAVLRPTGYKGSGINTDMGGSKPLFTESLQLANFPVCSWNTDTFKAWVAQNSVPLGVGAISSLATTAVSAQYAANDKAVIGTGIIGEVANIVGQVYKASIAADLSRGNLDNGCNNSANGYNQFNYGRASLMYQDAKVADDFMTMFGYTTRTIKIPNRSSRPHWNYTKTVGCTITGSVPCDDMRKICEIYDRGITFWKNGSEVGQYNLDNSPVS